MNDKRHLIFCHGFMTDERMWDQIRPGLEGFATCHFAEQGLDPSIREIARRILSGAPEHYIIVGFSMGGYIARELYRLAPERALGLVQMGTSARETPIYYEKRNKALIEAYKDKPFKGLSRKALIKSLHPKHADDEEMLAFLQTMAMDLGKDAFLNQLNFIRGDEVPLLGNIHCPCLVVWSDHDELRSLEESQELAKHIALAELVVIEDCGHMIPLEKPDECVRVLKDWITANQL